MSNRREATGRTAFGVPLGYSVNGAIGPPRVARGLRHENANRGCNVGGSGLRRHKFASGALRNRTAPKLYRRDGSCKG